jgi:acetyl esterase/lipase
LEEEIMRFKVITIWLTVLMVAFSAGCLKKGFNVVSKRQELNNLKEYGPMEDWGARCDHVAGDMVYAPGETHEEFLTLDVLWNDHEGLQPMVIQIHGGGWEVGDKNASNSLFRARYLANHGYVVFNINYRMLPNYPVQEQVEDVMGAVIWAKEHAADYGADPNRVGVTGGSAGGHLTAMVAWASDDPYFEPTGHADSEYDSDVQAAVPFYGVFDLERTLGGEPILGRSYPVQNLSYKYFTDAKKGPDRDEIFRHISPKYHADETVPPTFFICGDEDSFELYPDSVEYEKILRGVGVETGLYTAAGADHGFDVHWGADYTQEAIKLTKEWFDRFLK